MMINDTGYLQGEHDIAARELSDVVMGCVAPALADAYRANAGRMKIEIVNSALSSRNSASGAQFDD
ncbi:hypothetical protein [Burkholderia ambifaria]|uniref:hypothetical protein n=1 Tax=Burkholderia ambifaria TaxID=152480 RepID=UPI000F80A131|nr:hypothetical protein [Burkholderia ambifaria]UEP19990.1 hypothetical protein LL999_08260 [Burkholderia ambifaria]